MDFLLGWMLNMPLWLAILIFTLIMTFAINLVHKFTTNQTEMRSVRGRLKKLQAEMKKQRDNPKKLQKLNAEAMQLNGTYMKMSMRPLLFTFIPLIILFGWMNAHLALAPLAAGEDVTLTAIMDLPAVVTIDVPDELTIQGNNTKETIEKQVSWSVSGNSSGAYDVTLRTDNGDEAVVPFIVNEIPKSRASKLDKPFKSATVGYVKSKPFGDFQLFGYTPGWLFTYMLFSFAFNFVVRKLLNIA